MLRAVFIALILSSSLASAAEECIDISLFDTSPNRSQAEAQDSREGDDIKEVALRMKEQASFCISKALNGEPDLHAMSKKNLSLDMKIKVLSNGQLQAQCDCDSVVKTSNDIIEARYRIMAANCYSKVISRAILPKNKKISDKKIFCWDGRIGYKTSPKTNSGSGGGVK